MNAHTVPIICDMAANDTSNQTLCQVAIKVYNSKMFFDNLLNCN